MADHAIRPAAAADVVACATVLARAFQDDPGAIVFDADPDRRAEMLPGFFRAFVAASLAEDGELVVAGDPIEGIASWFGPDRHGPSGDAMVANGFGEVLERWGPEVSQRMLAMTGEIDRQHDQLITGPHFRLEFFGVDRSSRDRGSEAPSSSTATDARMSSDCRATSRRSPSRTSATTNAAATRSSASTRWVTVFPCGAWCGSRGPPEASSSGARVG